MHENLKKDIPHAEHCPALTNGREPHVFYMGTDAGGASLGFAWCPVCGALVLGRSKQGEHSLHPDTGVGVHAARPDGVNGCPSAMRNLLESIANGRTVPENPLVSLAVEWLTDELEARKIANEVTLRHYAELHAKWKEAAAMVDTARRATEAERDKRLAVEAQLKNCETIKAQWGERLKELGEKLHNQTELLRDVNSALWGHMTAHHKSYSFPNWFDVLHATRRELYSFHEKIKIALLNIEGGQPIPKRRPSKDVLLSNAIEIIGLLRNRCYTAKEHGFDLARVLDETISNLDNVTAALLTALPPAEPASEAESVKVDEARGHLRALVIAADAHRISMATGTCGSPLWPKPIANTLEGLKYAAQLAREFLG